MITLTLANGGQATYNIASTREIGGDYDRQLYRPPFSKKWRQAGDGKLEPERIAVAIEVFGELAEEQIEQIIRDAQDATSASSVFWQGPLQGLVSSVATPLEGGWRVQLEWLTEFSVEPGSVLEWTTWGQTDITFADLDDVTFEELD